MQQCTNIAFSKPGWPLLVHAHYRVALCLGYIVDSYSAYGECDRAGIQANCPPVCHLERSEAEPKDL